MKLYKEHGVNPLGGCLPLLLQLPVLFALFYVIRDPDKYLGESTALYQDLQTKALEVHQFLGLRLDCSPTLAWGDRASTVVDVSCGGNGFLSALPYLILLGLMGFTTWYQQKQMQASRGSDPSAQQMQMIGKIMPLFLVFFGFGFPAGVLIYWFASNLWTIVQQRIILKAAPPIVGAPAAPAKAAMGKTSKQASPKGAAAKGNTPAKGNGAPRPKTKPHPSSKKKKR
jgi:YidC/Oxa1 family membrane protein insertase